MNNKMTTFLKELIIIFTIITTSISSLFGMSGDPLTPPDSNYPLGEALEVSQKNLNWPEDQIFPYFAEPEEELIAFPDNILSHREMVALASLQGFVNAIETRVAILAGDVSKWLGDYGYSYKTVARENVYSHIKELCKGSVAGVVLYSDELSAEYMNLAASIGNMMNALPLTAEDYDKWLSEGIELPVLADIRGLTYDNPTEIYKYFFDNYWAECNKRVLVVQRPGLAFEMRDLAAATGGAVVYLSCAGGTETWLFKKYLNTMIPGKSIITGWYADQERELMTVAANCGLSCVPSDFFSNATVFAHKQDIAVPEVPDMPELENKIYIAYFLSDGDNIQYDMHAMREYWDNNSSQKGTVPVNWTISPALADIAPGMMNYYYSRATDKECFVCGPSGMGYTMPKNTFGANKGNQFMNNKKFTAYVDMTNRYLQRSGLRAVTIWDNLSLSQRNIYSK
ncbi:MAG: protein containing Coagulation factor 5/8 type, partial [Clostridia bacterium]|nr:protein containing Coagulation factor 5/8 type [Clostridia bacterium]